MIETSQIQTLVALLKSSSLSEAAEHMGVTQSAVSQHIKNIEGKIGLDIVSRQGKKFVLTPGGMQLAKLGQQYSKRYDDLISDLQQEKNRLVGHINLGTLFGLGKSWIAHRMVEFSEHFPEMSVKVGMDYPERLLEGLEARDYDCLVLPRTLIPAYYDHKFLHDESSILVFPDNDKFKITSKTSIKDLCDFPLIFFEERDPLFYQWVRSTYKSTPRNLTPRLVINAFGQMLQAVHDGLGIAVVPTHVLKRSYFHDKVKTLGKEAEVTNSSLEFVYHPEYKNSLKIETVFKFLEQEAQQFHL